MSLSRASPPTTAGKPFSSRLNPNDRVAVKRAQALRTDAESLRASVETSSVLFESEQGQFREIVKRAPSALGESAAQLQDLAGVGPRYFDDLVRYARRPSRGRVIAVLTAIIDTANERLLDFEGPHSGRWVENPYTLDSVRDLQSALTEIIEFIRTSNSLSHVPELEEESRRHLISLCKVVIELLEGPKVELGLLEQCAKSLKQLAPVVITAAVSAAVGAAVTGLMQPVERGCGAASVAGKLAA